MVLDKANKPPVQETPFQVSLADVLGVAIDDQTKNTEAPLQYSYETKKPEYLSVVALAARRFFT